MRVAGPSQPCSPMPVAGPLRHVPVAGVRIPWQPLPTAKVQQKRRGSPVPSESSSSTLTKESSDAESVIHVKSKKDKGKGRMQDKADPEASDKSALRKELKKRNVQTGHLCLKPCRRCHKLMLLCYNQVGGKACIHCVRSEIKCVEQGVEDGYVTEVIRLTEMTKEAALPRLTRILKSALPDYTLPPAPQP